VNLSLYEEHWTSENYQNQNLKGIIVMLLCKVSRSRDHLLGHSDIILILNNNNSLSISNATTLKNVNRTIKTIIFNE
jgi:hypothetical protein